MGRAKKLRSLEWQQKKLEEELKQSFKEIMNDIKKKKKDKR